MNDDGIALPQLGNRAGGALPGSIPVGIGELPAMPALPDRAAIIEGGGRGAAGVLDRYRAGVGVFRKELLGLDDASLDTAFRPEAGVGRWPIRVVLGHLADAELVNAFRFRKTVAEEGAILASWDFEAFLDSGMYDGVGAGDGGSSGKPAGRSGQPIAAYLALIHAVRSATGEWLSLLPSSAWERVALHEERGPMTLRDLVGGCAWHLEHHAWFVEAKARRLAGVSVLSAVGVGG